MSNTDLDTQILNDNVVAAINASERLHLLAKRKLQDQGLAAGTNGSGSTQGEATSLSDGVITALAKAIVPFVKELISEAVAECLRDGGTWQEGKTYQRSQVVQDHGAVWVCTVPNATSRPPSDDWRLWVRREKRVRP